MRYIKSFLIVLLLSTFFPLAAFAELNNAKDEDTQTIAFEIVGNNDSSKDDNGAHSLPQTGEVSTHVSQIGLGIIISATFLVGFHYKKGKRDNEAK